MVELPDDPDKYAKLRVGSVVRPWTAPGKSRILEERDLKRPVTARAEEEKQRLSRVRHADLSSTTSKMLLSPRGDLGNWHRRDATNSGEKIPKLEQPFTVVIEMPHHLRENPVHKKVLSHASRFFEERHVPEATFRLASTRDLRVVPTVTTKLDEAEVIKRVTQRAGWGDGLEVRDRINFPRHLRVPPKSPAHTLCKGRSFPSTPRIPFVEPDEATEVIPDPPPGFLGQFRTLADHPPKPMAHVPVPPVYPGGRPAYKNYLRVRARREESKRLAEGKAASQPRFSGRVKGYDPVFRLIPPRSDDVKEGTRPVYQLRNPYARVY